MSVSLPEGITAGDEISVEWKRDDVSTKVTIGLGEATIVVDCGHEAVDTLPWLIAALPTILEQAWDAIEGQETTQEES